MLIKSLKTKVKQNKVEEESFEACPPLYDDVIV